MITFEQALTTVLDGVAPLDGERVHVIEAVGRVLAEDVLSDIDMPPFNKSAMDGYACRRADLDRELTVVEVIKAGFPPEHTIKTGQCAKIMTGAMVPEGADCVVMVEHTETPTENTMRFTGGKTQDNICPRGEDMKVGGLVLRRGTRIAPREVAMLSAVGCVEPFVTRRPRVGVISTGDELVEPEVKPAPSQIRTSNSYQLHTQAAEAGGAPTYYGIARDVEGEIDRLLRRAIAENDLVLLSGGVSMGDFDLVPQIMRENGIEIVFDAVAMKPGKPTTFGRSPGKYCFGLPGNPVSTFVQFELLVKPLIGALLGAEHRPLEFPMPLRAPITRRGLDRAVWLPVRLTDDGGILPCTFHGSAHVGAICEADGLISIPVGVAAVDAGTLMNVRPIRS